MGGQLLLLLGELLFRLSSLLLLSATPLDRPRDKGEIGGAGLRKERSGRTMTEWG